MLSSAAVYFGSLGLGICVFVVFFSARFPALFKVPAEYAADSVFFATSEWECLLQLDYFLPSFFQECLKLFSALTC